MDIRYKTKNTGSRECKHTMQGEMVGTKNRESGEMECRQVRGVVRVRVVVCNVRDSILRVMGRRERFRV